MTKLSKIFIVVLFTIFANIDFSNAQQWSAVTTNNNIWNLNTGNVGIGTPTPHYPLDVNGIINTNANIQLGSGQVNSYVKINTDSHSWWTGVGVDSGDDRFVIYDATNQNYGLTIGTDGNVSIGSANKGANLNVTGSVSATNDLSVSGAGPDIGGAISIINTSKTTSGQASTWKILNVGSTKYYGATSLQFWAYDNTGCSSGLCNNRFTLADNGNVGIGTTNPQNMLDVKGTIRAVEVKVESIDKFADFVFDPGYQLPTLNQVSSFIQVNKHLPNIPTATEVKENGMNLADMQVKLLQKVEELTLYMIEQQKQIEELKKELNEKGK